MINIFDSFTGKQNYAGYIRDKMSLPEKCLLQVKLPGKNAAT